MATKMPKAPEGTHYTAFSVRHMRDDLVRRMRAQCALRGTTLGEMVNLVCELGIAEVEKRPIPVESGVNAL